MVRDTCSQFVLNYVAGAGSGLIEVLTTHPIDLMKTKMQEAMLKNKSSKFIYVFKSVYTNYGLKGYYKGLLPRIVGIVPMRLVFWGTQNSANYYFITKKDKLRIPKLFFNGILGGFAQTLVDNPIEVLKIRKMTNNTSPYYIKDLITRGFKITAFRNIIFAICVNISINYKENNTHSERFMLGAIGGCIGSAVTQPIDLIKTEQQRNNHKVSYKIIFDIFKKSPKALWTGILPRCVLGFSTMGIGVISLNMFNKFFDYLNL